MPWIRHDSHGQTTIKNRQALGGESPLKTDDDGYVHVEDEDAADLLATLDRHVETAGPPQTADDGEAEDADDFDAVAFVDRTPMEEVIADLETGDFDEHLDAIEAEAERDGVLDAIDDRRE